MESKAMREYQATMKAMAEASLKQVRPHQMTSHEVAKALLAEPDLPLDIAIDFEADPMVALSVYTEGGKVFLDIGPLDEDD